MAFDLDDNYDFSFDEVGTVDEDFDAANDAEIDPRFFAPPY